MILDLEGISFHAVVDFGLISKSVIGHCDIQGSFHCVEPLATDFMSDI